MRRDENRIETRELNFASYCIVHGGRLIGSRPAVNPRLKVLEIDISEADSTEGDLRKRFRDSEIFRFLGAREGLLDAIHHGG